MHNIQPAPTMSAGNGHKYLLRTVVVGGGKRSMSTPLTRYYTAKGAPPARWMGEGLRSFGAGLIFEGAEVTEEPLQLLIGQGRDPLTADASSNGNAQTPASSGEDMQSSRHRH
jgi:hypothetical protein